MSAFNKTTPARQISNLVIVESPLKAETVSEALKKGGMTDYFVLSIGDQIFSYPADGSSVGINNHYEEVGRMLSRSDVVRSIQSWSALATKVYIATNADQVGDSLAFDVSSVMAGRQESFRVRVRALDPGSLMLAFANAEQLRERDAWPDVTRRMADRLTSFCIAADIGRAGFDFEVTRTMAGVIGSIALGAKPFGEAVLAIPCEDGGLPFSCAVPVFHYNRVDVESLLKKCNEFCDEGGVFSIAKSAPFQPHRPWGYGEALIEISRQASLSVVEVDTALRVLYESGRVSYPFTFNTSLSSEAISVVMQIASKRGINFVAKNFSVFTRDGRHEHEAIRPLDSDIDIGSPIGLLKNEDAVLSLLTRNILACGLPYSKHTPELSDLPAWAAKLKFARVVCNRVQPWPRKAVESGIRQFSAGESIVSILSKEKIGRQVNWIAECGKLNQQNLFDSQLRLTEKANRLIELVPAILCNPETASSLDQMIDLNQGKSGLVDLPSESVRRIFGFLGLAEAASKVLDRGHAQAYQMHGLTEE